MISVNLFYQLGAYVDEANTSLSVVLVEISEYR